MVKFSYYIVIIIFLVAFFQGLMTSLGISTLLSNVILQFFIFILFFISMYFFVVGRKFFAIGKTYLILLFTVVLISFLLCSLSLLHLVLFFKDLFIPLLFLIALQNIPFSIKQRKKIFNLIIILFLIQIPATFIKLFFVGLQEDYIGSISNEAGSVATILPMLAVSYILAYSFNYKNKKILLLIPFFILVGLASAKLAVILYIIIIIIVIFFYNNKLNSFFNIKLFFTLIKFSAFIALFIYMFAVFNPRVNPEGKIGGSFNLEYFLNEVERYTTRDTGAGGAIAASRAEAPAIVFDLLINKSITTFLLGIGPGDIVKSGFLPYDDPAFSKYNLGYGVRTGFLWTIMQIGIIGVFIYLLFHLNLLRRVQSKFKYVENLEHKVILLTALGASATFFIDYLTYSTVMMKQPAMSLIYLYLLYYAINYDKQS